MGALSSHPYGGGGGVVIILLAMKPKRMLPLEPPPAISVLLLQHQLPNTSTMVPSGDGRRVEERKERLLRAVCLRASRLAAGRTNTPVSNATTLFQLGIWPGSALQNSSPPPPSKTGCSVYMYYSIENRQEYPALNGCITNERLFDTAMPRYSKVRQTARVIRPGVCLLRAVLDLGQDIEPHTSSCLDLPPNPIPQGQEKKWQNKRGPRTRV